MRKRVLVLGCTGSIGSSTLDIVRNMRDKFEVVGLSANKSASELKKLADEFSCPATLFSSEGEEGLERLIKSTKADIAVNGVAGAAGLMPSVKVLENGIDLALANKETVVMAYPLIKALAIAHNAKRRVTPLKTMVPGVTQVSIILTSVTHWLRASRVVRYILVSLSAVPVRVSLSR